MALQTQLIPIKFGQGIDTKTDPKQQLLATFRKAKNVTYETISAIKKRNGYDVVPLYTVGNEYLISAQKIVTFKNELDIFSNNVLYSFSDAVQKLSPKGPVYPVYTTSTPVINAASSCVSSDVVTVGNLEVHVYATAANEARYSVKDNTNGSFLASNNLLGTGEQVKVVAINNVAFIFYSSGATINLRRVALTVPEVAEAVVPVANNLNTSSKVWDVEFSQNAVFLAYNSSVAGARLRIVKINSDGTVGTGIGIPSSPDCKAITLDIDYSSRVNVFFASSTELRAIQLNFLLTSIMIASTLLETVADVRTIGTLETLTSGYKLWYEVAGASAIYNYIKAAEISNSFSIVVAPSVFVRGLGLWSKPYYVNSAAFIPTVFGSELQSTAFVLDESANVVTKAAPETSSGLITIGSLPHTMKIAEDQALISSRYATRIQAENEDFLSVLGVASTVISHIEDNPLQTATLGDNLHVSGGLLRAYDGDELVEHGFNMFPDSITAGTNAASGGFMSNGNYGFVAVYKWTDNYGQEHRSTPSPNLDVTLSAGGTTQTQQIIVPSYRLTDKSEVVVEIYRTEASGSIYYLTASAANNPAVDTITITCTEADSTLIAKLPLYTTGDVLANGQAPSARLLAVHTSSNRVFAVAEDENLLIYSKIRDQGKPVEWNPALVKPVDAVGGPITALASMDEKMVIFKQSAILFIAGSGPNNLGQQDSFTEPERVAIDVGCTDPSSVVLTPNGLMFKSSKGIYLLSRSMGIQYVGAPVEEYNALTITSAKLVSTNNQVRFTTLDGDCLVYNYLLGLWSTFDNHQAKSAEIVGTSYYYVRTDGSLFKENATSFSDNGSPISILIETAWMSVAGLQGFQRAYKMLVLGDYKSSHQLRVRAAYNFVNAWTHEKILNPVPDVVTGSTYGSVSPYGEESVYGGEASPYQARFDFEKQKCQAIKLQFQDLQTVAGEGLSLSALTMEVGTKKGLYKPGQAKIKGVS